MLSIRQFNGLGGTTATRESLLEIRNNAIKDGNEEIISRIDTLLVSYPDAEIFEDIQLDDHVIEPVPDSFLHGLDYEEIEDEGEGLGKVSPTEVYDMITAKVIKMIADANLPGYKKKWKAGEYGTGYTIPFNFVTKKRYRGVNVLMLTELEPLENPFFLTFKQVNDLKGKVKKGAKGYEVVYFTKIWKVEDRPKNLKLSSYDKAKVESFRTENSIENDLGVIPMLKYYHVYNGKDIEGIDFKLDSFKTGFIDAEKPSIEANKMPIPEAIIKNYPSPQPILKFGGNRAFHQGGGVGLIQMPYLADFETVQDYYRTLFHEYSHSTGSPQRLNRKLGNKFGSKDYAFEELIAEMGAVFLSAESGIIWHNDTNHAAYLKSWNSVLPQIKGDNKFIMRASTAAQKVADFVLQFDDNGDPLYFKDLAKLVEKKEVAKSKNKIVWVNQSIEDDDNNLFSFTNKKGTVLYGINHEDETKGAFFAGYTSEKNFLENELETIYFHPTIEAAKIKAIDLLDEKLMVNFVKSKTKPVTNKLQDFEIETITKAFQKRYGLQTALKNAVSQNDKLKLEAAIDSLATATGMRKVFIKKHVSEIVDLVVKDGKKPTDYGKKNKRVAKPKAPQYSFSENDIPYETAYRAYTGISFSPEKRAVSEQKSYFEFLKSVYDENLVIATKNDKLEIFKSNFETFQKGYLKRTLEYLRSKHGIFSSMIAGPAKFPVARMEKLNRIANDKLNELIDYGNKGQKRLLQNITAEVDKPIKTGATGTLKVLQEKLAEAEKIHQRNLDGNKFLKKIRANKEATIQDYIDGFIAIGFDPETAKKEANYVTTYSYAGFFTTNSNAKVKRIKEQIALEEKLKAKAETTGNIEYTFDGGTVLLNYEDNKIQIFYNEKPSEEERTKLKKSGNAFKWSPFNKAWQRQLNTYPLRYLKELLPTIDLQSRKTDKDQETAKETPTKPSVKPVSKVQKKTKEVAKKPVSKPKTAAKYPSGTKVEWDGETYVVGKVVQMTKDISSTKYLLVSGNKEVWTDQNSLDIQSELNKVTLPKEVIQPTLFGGLSVPITGTIEDVFTPEPEKVIPQEQPREEKVNLPLNTLAYRRQNRNNTTHEYYKIENPNIADFLGKIEKKKKDSVAITIAGGQGSGKTSFVFQLINEFAKHYKVGHASIEEHPESALYEDKAERFWNENAKNTVDSPEINTKEDIHKLILRNDVIVIDSFSKLLSMDRKITLDETFRKKYDGKLFIIIYQLTTDGSMRGGSASQFDGDVILFVEKFPNFNDNYVYADKNRYQTANLEELHYNIATAQLLPPEEPEEEIQFTEEVERI